MCWDINAKLFYEYVLPFYFAACPSVRPPTALTSSSSFQPIILNLQNIRIVRTLNPFKVW